MDFINYLNLFDEILTAEHPVAPYDNSAYFNYAELNQKRQERWYNKGELTNDAKETLSRLNQNLNWILITEPWCGDAAHSSPFLSKLAEASEKIKLQIQLRDTNSEINNYLTHGGKSIPLLIVRDENGKDIFRWGPRPEGAQKIQLKNKESDKSDEEKRVELQKWYNTDKGVSIQREIILLLKSNLLVD
jgi:hypothetical protein